MSEDTDPFVGQPMDRRAVIAWCVALAAAIPAANYLSDWAMRPAAPPEPGYGTDPRLDQYVAPWARLLSANQRLLVGALCDHILPAEGSRPSASSLNLFDLIDEWVSAPYPDQLADRAVILEGLEWIETEARAQGGRSWFDAEPRMRNAVLDAWTGDGQPSTIPPKDFYLRMRRLTIGGYYTTGAGFGEIGYIGNEALKSFPPVRDDTMALLETRMAALGI